MTAGSAGHEGGVPAPAGRTSGPPTGLWAGALGLTLLVAIFPQFAIGALGPQLRADLALDPADIGLVFAGFIGLGVVGSPLAGPLADRVGGRRSCFALLLVTGAALVAASLATSMAGLILSLLPAGAAMALANPGTNRWASSARDTRTQATLVGVAQAGVQAGALLAGALAGANLLGLDWRGALRVGAAIALIGAVATWWAPRDVGSPITRRGRSSDPASDGGTSASATRDLRALATYAMFMGGGTAIVFAYLPSYAVDVAGFSVAAAGATTMVFGGTALLCRLGLGVAIRRPEQVGPPLLIGMALGSAVAIGLVGAGVASPTWIWVGAVAFGATGTTWPALAFLAVVRVSPPGGAGRVTGWVTAAFYLGLLVTPPLAGRLIGAAGYRWLWLGAIACYLVAIVPVRNAPRPRPSVPARSGSS